MANLIIYHNPQCSTSRQGIEYLKERGIDFDIVDYMKTPLTPDDILKIMAELDTDPASMVRQKEIKFVENPFDVNSAETVAEKLAATPRLMERPILRGFGTATIGRPLDKFKRILES